MVAQLHSDPKYSGGLLTALHDLPPKTRIELDIVESRALAHQPSLQATVAALRKRFGGTVHTHSTRNV